MRLAPGTLAALIVLAVGAGPATAQPDHPDTCAAAAAVAIDAPPLEGIIDPPTDHDWFTFDAMPGHLYNVRLFGASAGFLPRLDIAAADCETPLLGWASHSTNLATPQGGPHRLRVSAYLRENSGGLGSDAGGYSLEVIDLGPSPDDVGDTPAAAAGLAADSPPTLGRIDYDGDTDFYRVPLQERTVYEIHAADLGCSAVAASVLSRDGASFMGSSFSYGYNAGPGEECVEDFAERARVYVPADAGGDYFVQIFGAFGGTTEYSLTVTTLASFPPGDDHGDTCANPTPLVLGAPPITGVHDPVSDVDAYSFTALAGHFYRIHLDRLAALTLLGADCATPIDIPLWGAPSFVAPTDGLYRILAASRFDIAGAYTLAVTDEGAVADDYGNTPAVAATIPADGAETPGQIDYPGDIDMFRLNLQPHATYHIEVRTPGCTSTSAQLFGPEDTYIGNLPAVGGGNPCASGRTYERVIYVPLGAGADYLLELSGLPGSYTVTATPTALFGSGDAHPDTCAAAAPIAINAPPLAATIDPPTDVDWFVFEAAAGHVYQIDVPDTTNRWPLIEVRADGCTDDDALVIPGQTGSRIFRAVAPGPHHISVRFFEFPSGARPGPYTIGVSDLGPAIDDHAGGPAHALRLRTDGSPIAGRADYPGDTDAFRVWLRPQTLYRIELRSNNCAPIYGTLFGSIPRTYRSELHSLPAPGCQAPPNVHLPYYAPTTEPGDYLISIGSQTVGSAYTLSVQPIGCLADFNNSGAVNPADISSFLTTWLNAAALPHPANLAADFDGDTLTNSADIAAFLTAWLAAATHGCRPY